MCAPEVMTHVHRTIGEGGPRVTRRGLLGAAGLAALGGVLAPRAAVATPAEPAISIRARSVVDLTHTLTPDFPVWPGSEAFTMAPVVVIDPSPLGSVAGVLGGSSGPARGEFHVNRVSYCEHVGTHIDAPAHKIVGGRTVEELPIEDFVAPIAVVDISERARTDADAVLTVADIEAWERAHGRLPARSLVAMNSGWAAHVANPRKYVGLDATGTPHSPGFDPDAVSFLVEERDIVAIGVDTLSLDAARSRTYCAHVAALGAGKYGIESLANLSALPPAGATVVVGAPKHRGGSGGPCRVLAFVD
ncbi:cyclase family protein [Prescottella equi]|uniref:cyclase family protein n=1 Tax=Rhodococcus hoagii TaxID=43767 RepID=UPI000A1165C4|nr:cyclase family protein [Prescottella equi]NKR45400.1 cyclase family protein [Prescottella equi]ORJ95440.1 cyclase [Prescottella equi]